MFKTPFYILLTGLSVAIFVFIGEIFLKEMDDVKRTTPKSLTWSHIPDDIVEKYIIK